MGYIYKIQSKFSSKVYIGQTSYTNYKERFWEHRGMLKGYKHHNTYLQRTYNKYEKLGHNLDEIFEFEVLMYNVKPEELSEWEQSFVDAFREITGCYNAVGCVDNPMKGKNHTEETKKKISEATKGKHSKPLSEETKKNMSIAQKKVKRSEEQINIFKTMNIGRKATPEARTNMSKTRTGKKHTPETKEKCKYIRLGKKQTQEAKDKISKANTGKKRTEEQKQQISERGKGRKHTQETKDKIRDKHIGKEFTDEHKANISSSQKGKKLSEEHKQKIGEAGMGREVTKVTRDKIRNGNTSKVLKQIYSPDGELFEFYSFTEFSKEHNLSNAHLCDVIGGKRNHTGGWTVDNKKPILHNIISPNGEVFSFYDISKFVRENKDLNLEIWGISKLLTGKINNHRGWTLPKDTG